MAFVNPTTISHQQIFFCDATHSLHIGFLLQFLHDRTVVIAVSQHRRTPTEFSSSSLNLLFDQFVFLVGFHNEISKTMSCVRFSRDNIVAITLTADEDILNFLDVVVDFFVPQHTLLFTFVGAPKFNSQRQYG